MNVSWKMELLLTFSITGPWPGYTTEGLRFRINSRDFKYSDRSSNTEDPSPSIQSPLKIAFSSFKYKIIWSVVCPGVWITLQYNVMLKTSNNNVMKIFKHYLTIINYKVLLMCMMVDIALLKIIPLNLYKSVFNKIFRIQN